MDWAGQPHRRAGPGRPDDSRAGILDGSVAADLTDEAFQRGFAQASLAERVQATGLDRFDSIAHDQRVDSFIAAQREVRRHWITDAPARLLDRRESDGHPSVGGLTRELAKTRQLLGTRALLRNYGRAVQDSHRWCSPARLVQLTSLSQG